MKPWMVILFPGLALWAALWFFIGVHNPEVPVHTITRHVTVTVTNQSEESQALANCYTLARNSTNGTAGAGAFGACVKDVRESFVKGLTP